MTQSEDSLDKKLLRFEPDGESRLYSGLDDKEVDNTEEVFTQEWLEKATLLKIRTISKHITAGHIGPVEKIAPKQWRFHDGHRAICRFNNGRYTKSRVLTVSRSQAQEIKQRLGSVYDSSKHLAVYRYNADEAKELATQRVDNEIKEGLINWKELDPTSREYQQCCTERINYYYKQLLNEVMLIRKEESSDGRHRQLEDLPFTVLYHIEKKLPKTEAEYFIGQFFQQRDIHPESLENPVIEFYVGQAILEQLVIQKRRDFQTLAGDIADETTEKALTEALKRLGLIMKPLI